LASDILPLSAKLRVLFEPFAPRKPNGVDESVFDFAARRIGVGAAEVLVDAMVTGIYGGDPRALSLRSAFPRMAELESEYGSLIKAQIALARARRRLPSKTGSQHAAGAPVGTMFSFKDGLGELTRALASRLEVRTGSSVERLERIGDRFRVSGSGATLETDAVVFAIPAYDASRILEPHAAEEARAIGGIPYAPVAVVVQGFRREDLGAELDGFGFLVPGGERRRVLGSIFASSVFPEHVPEGFVMMRSMIGGARHPELLHAGDDEVSEIVRGELASLMETHVRKTPTFERIVRWPRAIPQYNLGHSDRVEAADAIETRVPGVFMTGNAFRGVAMIACIVDADRTSERILSRVSSGQTP
jgi:oxygen-dependent protoporphyrinogen oxidase